jgi:hypothetical protein
VSKRGKPIQRHDLFASPFTNPAQDGEWVRYADVKDRLDRLVDHEPVVVWRGSVTDLVTDLAALLTTEQLAELAGEAALAWRKAAKKVKP